MAMRMGCFIVDGKAQFMGASFPEEVRMRTAASVAIALDALRANENAAASELDALPRTESLRHRHIWCAFAL